MNTSVSFWDRCPPPPHLNWLYNLFNLLQVLSDGITGAWKYERVSRRTCYRSSTGQCTVYMYIVLFCLFPQAIPIHPREGVFSKRPPCHIWKFQFNFILPHTHPLSWRIIAGSTSCHFMLGVPWWTSIPSRGGGGGGGGRSNTPIHFMLGYMWWTRVPFQGGLVVCPWPYALRGGVTYMWDFCRIAHEVVDGKSS